MIRIGHNMNGFVIAAASMQFRAGEPFSVVILGTQPDGHESYKHVVATTDIGDNPTSWDSGWYTGDGAKAARQFLKVSGLADVAAGEDEK